MKIDRLSQYARVLLLGSGPGDRVAHRNERSEKERPHALHLVHPDRADRGCVGRPSGERSWVWDARRPGCGGHRRVPGRLALRRGLRGGRRRLHSQLAHRLRRGGHSALGNSTGCAGPRLESGQEARRPHTVVTDRLGRLLLVTLGSPPLTSNHWWPGCVLDQRGQPESKPSGVTKPRFVSAPMLRIIRVRVVPSVLNVGWLDTRHSFPRGESSSQFIDRLSTFLLNR